MNPPMRKKMSELSDACGLSVDIIMQFVAFEWVHPFDQEHEFFDEEDIARIRLIKDLNRMGINEEGIDVILHLIDQLNRLHIEIKREL